MNNIVVVSIGPKRIKLHPEGGQTLERWEPSAGWVPTVEVPTALLDLADAVREFIRAEHQIDNR